MEENIRIRITALIKDSRKLRAETEFGSKAHIARCKAWMLGALNVVRVVSPEEGGLYRKRAEQLAAFEHQAADHLGDFGEPLLSLLADIKLGLVSSVSNRARAETFADFLDHIARQSRNQKKNAS